MVDPQLLTSSKEFWETPQWFFEVLHEEFAFEMDVFASAHNAKLPRFLTKDDDAFACVWPDDLLTFFGNPPYGKGKNVENAVFKAAEEAARIPGRTVVLLVAGRTGTAWFQDLAWELADEIRFVRGRLVFEIDGKPLLGKDGKPMPATFDSAVFVFRHEPTHRIAGMPMFVRMEGRNPEPPL